jgi:hypothetical protein
MKRQSIRRQSALGGLLLFMTFILTGCGITSPIQTQVLVTPGLQSTQMITTSTNPPATFTTRPFMTPTRSITPTKSPSPTYTLTPTVIPSMTALPILPTLSPSEAVTLIKDLLVNNAGCKLPCWWGFTPGTSVWNTADQFFESFTLVDGPVFYEVDHIRKVGYEIKFRSDERELAFGVGVDDNEVISDFGIPPVTSIYGYKLDQLLTNNGQPEEVWLAPMPDTPGGSWYYLVLYYPTQGIMARYGGSATPSITLNDNGEAIINSLQICPLGVGPELWLVPPNTLNGVKGNSALGGEAFTDILIPIKQATGLSIEEFYKTFRTGDSSTCFDTSSESWP